MNYLKKIYAARYFWFYLALSDLRQKYRRSVLGIFWSTLQPLGMTLLLSFVLGNLFNNPIADYAPYVFSGMIFWEYFSNATIGGCNAFIFSQTYIRQCTHPYLIYTLRHVLFGWMNFLLAFIGLFIWVIFWRPENFSISWLILPFSFLIILIVNWLLASLFAFIATIFRDFSQLIVLLLQALWFISPVFMLPKDFEKGGLGFLVHLNPIYHLIELMRAPLLQGKMPTGENFLFVLMLLVCLIILNALFIYKKEKELIFYI